MEVSDVATDQPDTPHWLRGRHGRSASSRRWAGALLATGSYALLAGAVLLLPFALNPYYVNQNDVYLGNYCLAPLFFVGGACSLLAGLLRLGRSHDADVRGHRLGLLLRAPLLAAVAAAAVVYATFAVGGRYYSYGENPPNWPPYLNLALLGVTLGLGVVVWAVAWLWAGAGSRAGSRAGSGAGASAALLDGTSGASSTGAHGHETEAETDQQRMTLTPRAPASPTETHGGSARRRWLAALAGIGGLALGLGLHGAATLVAQQELRIGGLAFTGTEGMMVVPVCLVPLVLVAGGFPLARLRAYGAMTLFVVALFVGYVVPSLMRW